MKATLKNYRQSPRKVRLVTDMVKGKSLAEALTLMRFKVKRAADPIHKLLRSAASNAEKQGENIDALMVKNITVNAGVTMHRSMPRAQGRATPIRKRSSHISITLAPREARSAKRTMQNSAHVSKQKTFSSPNSNSNA